MRKLVFTLLSISISSHALAKDRAWDLLKDNDFKQIYKLSLGKYAQEPWLEKLSGPSGLNSTVVIGADEYVLFSTCKQHACDTDNMVSIYSKKLNKVYGLILKDNTLQSFGNPPEDIKSKLHSIYIKENPNNKNVPIK